MSIFRKKNTPPPGEQGNNPDPALYAGASRWEKLEQEKKPGASLRQIAKATEEIWFTERIRIEDSLSDLSGMISSLLNGLL